MKVRCNWRIGVVLAGVLFGSVADSQQAAPPAQAGRGAPVLSPEILADNRVTFRLAAPKAAEVALNGNWEGGSAIPMVKDSQGIWSVTAGPLAPELWQYAFTVDGVRALDPGNADSVRDGRRLFNPLLIPGPGSALYENKKDVPHGNVNHVWYPSPTLKMPLRRMYIYTPPGYENSTAKYPVLYLHHGGGGDEDAWTTLGRLPEIIDNLIAQGKAKPMIVVMPNMNSNEIVSQGFMLAPPPVRAPAPAAAPAASRDNRNGQARSANGNWALEPYPGSYAESIVKDIIPYVEKNYRADARSESRAIAGLSMGGGPVASASNNNPRMFGYIGLFSSRPKADEAQAKAFAAMKAAGAVKLYWVSAGTTDFANAGAKEVYELVKKIGFPNKFSEVRGSHEWSVWRLNISELAPMLFR